MGHVKGSDKDSGKNGKFDCHLKGADRVYRTGQEYRRGEALSGERGEEERRGDKEFFRLKRMFSKEYNVITAQAIDREALSRDVGSDDVFFQLLLVCQDHGVPALTSKKQLLVYVNDVNDNAPIITQHSFYFKIAENHAVTQAIGVVMATDSDAGDNSRITYSLSNFQYRYHDTRQGDTFYFLFFLQFLSIIFIFRFKKNPLFDSGFSRNIVSLFSEYSLFFMIFLLS